MTKEELKQEAKERADEYTNLRPFHIGYEEGYFDGAEPREKKIKSLGERCLQLQKDKGELTDKVAELEAQIEKMKCCGNCIHCKYDENEESYEWCEVHDQIVNITIQPCSEYEIYNFDKAIKEIKEK